MTDTCSLCDGVAYVQVPGGMSPCLKCEAGQKIANRLVAKKARGRRFFNRPEPKPSAARFERVLNRYDPEQKELQL